MPKQMRIVVDESTWERLNQEKKAGEDFNAVLVRMLDRFSASISKSEEMKKGGD